MVTKRNPAPAGKPDIAPPGRRTPLTISLSASERLLLAKLAAQVGVETTEAQLARTCFLRGLHAMLET